MSEQQAAVQQAVQTELQELSPAAQFELRQHQQMLASQQAQQQWAPQIGYISLQPTVVWRGSRTKLQQ